jgi:hypothetical protein
VTGNLWWRALERFNGNRKKAATALNISPMALWREMKEYGRQHPHALLDRIERDSREPDVMRRETGTG